jgi:acetyltransferase
MQPPVKGKRVAVISNAGGVAIMAVDSAEHFGLSLVELTQDVTLELKQYLPEAASVHNPIDILGDADDRRYQDTLSCIIQSEGIDAIMLICTPQFMTDRRAVIRGMSNSIEKARRLGIVLITVFPSVTEDGLQDELDRYDLPNYEFPEVAMRSLADAVHCKESMEQLMAWEQRPFRIDRVEKVHAWIDALLTQGLTYLNEPQSYELLALYNVPIAQYGFAHDEGEAMSRALSFEYPVVAKVVADGVFHKYDIGGVETDIKGVLDMEKAFLRLSDTVSKSQFKGVLVQEQVKGGVELIIGVEYHPGFGHAIMFGLGGTLVEVMKDVVFAMAPLSRSRAEEMVFSIKGAKLFSSFRGRPPVDTGAIVELLLTFSDLVMEEPRIASLDINPLFASHHGVTIADARVVLREK